ncbi:hypothetical protein R1sor_014066 [Riccia sorocarpa]|uniref:Uncharacterized protein n=1 Tax=Riccia sorocarpa TaxID=122646 RepID=A0ABD3HAY1_9MARC
MAAIPAKNVHTLIHQLDLAAVEANKEVAGELELPENENQAALLLESLGIHHWLNIQHTFSTKGEDTTVKSNPLINFAIFTEEEKASFTEGLESLTASATGEKASVNDNGDPYIPTDTPRTIEYRVSEKLGMMWKCSNMNNLAPITLDMWSKMVNLSEGELSACKSNAIQGIIPAKVISLRETIKMVLFRDKYKCTESVSVRVKVNVVTDSNRVSKHRALLWNWIRPYFKCNCKFDSTRKKCKGEIIWLDHAIWYIFNHMEDFFPLPSIQARYMAFLIFLGSEARTTVLAHCSFMYTRELMVETAMEVFADPSNRTLPEHGDANGVRMIERLMKPACFSDTIISNQIQAGSRRRNRQPINLNSAPTRIIPMGRGQRMRGGRQFSGNRQFYQTPRSSSSSSRSFSSSFSGFPGPRNGPNFRSMPIGRRNMANEFANRRVYGLHRRIS